MYTVTCDYSATGEGVRYMVLFCQSNDATSALNRFGQIFGRYFTNLAKVSQGANFDFVGSTFLLTEKAAMTIISWPENAVHYEYHASMHVNL